MPNLSSLRTLSPLLMILVCIGNSSAQVQRSGSAGAQLMQQYQQIASERSQLQVENAKLKKDLEDAKKQLTEANKETATLKTGAGSSKAALAAAAVANENNLKRLDESNKKLQELIAHYRETATQLRDVETSRTQLQQQLTKANAAFDTCADRNYSLYQINGEVLDHYEHQNMFSYLERSEPFTRLKRTQIDNLVYDYRQRAEELRVKKPPAPGATTSAPANAPPGHSN